MADRLKNQPTGPLTAHERMTAEALAAGPRPWGPFYREALDDDNRQLVRYALQSRNAEGVHTPGPV
jgi:hypothetical protein